MFNKTNLEIVFTAQVHEGDDFKIIDPSYHDTTFFWSDWSPEIIFFLSLEQYSFELPLDYFAKLWFRIVENPMYPNWYWYQ